MALQTKTFATGDLAWASWSNAYGLELVLTEESISVSDNSSLVSYRLQLRSGSQNRFANYVDSAVTFQGETVGQSREYRYLDFNSTWVLLSGQREISHDEMGDGLLSFSASISPDPGNQWAPPDMQITGELLLTAIPRASTVGAADADIGKAVSICVGRKLPQHRHSIFWEFGQLSGYIGDDWHSCEQEVLLEDTAIAFTLPVDWHYQIPDSQSGLCRLTCKTYLAQTLVGQTQCAFTARADAALCKPSLSCRVWDENPATLALTEDENILVRYASNARCSAQAEAALGASIKSLTVNGLPLGTVFEGAEPSGYVFRAEDSRGFVTEQTLTPDTVAYIPVTAVVTIRRSDPTDNSPEITITGNYYHGSFGALDNALSILCALPDGTQVELSPQFREGGYTAAGALPGLSYNSAHQLTLQVTDLAHRIERVITLPKGLPVFHWGEEDFAFQVPVSFFGGVRQLYPVGSVYLSTMDQDPAALFGGSWQRIRDVFLLCGGEAFPPGTVGGEATHTLTEAEMPVHSHNGAVKTDMEGHTQGDFSDVRMWGEANTQSLTLTDTAGGGLAHNNLPPYLAVYAWQRVA